MDADKLPDEHDVIVLGTGMTESIVAAALSRIGLRVLHLDRNDNYGGDWGSFNFTALLQWMSVLKAGTEPPNQSLNESELASRISSDEKLLFLPVESSTISNLQESVHILGCAEQNGDAEGDKSSSNLETKEKETKESSNIPEAKVKEENQGDGKGDTMEANADATPGDKNVTVVDKPSTEENRDGNSQKSDAEKPKESDVEKGPGVSLDYNGVLKQWRKFNIDLMPKVLYSRGPLVELLISSDVAKYCEFRTITRVLTLLNEKLEVVPCSRADVFASHDVTVIEKRLLMKFLTFAIEFQKHPTQYTGFEDRPFTEFLKSKHLTATIQHYVKHAIAMVPRSANTMEGLEATQKFLLSLGRYGNTAFLWPLYGSGELLQCFCRMCAVFGGIYCLRRTARAIILNSNNEVCGIIDSEGQRLKAKYVIMDASYASPQFLPQISKSSLLSRGILITDRSIKPHKEQHISIMSLPLPGRDDSRATVYELSSLSLACPEGFHVVHLTCRSLAADAKTDLQSVVDDLFQSPEQDAADESRPRIIWSLFFNVVDTSKMDLTCSDVQNLFVVGGPDSALDCDRSISVARTIFEKICPGEEFLPKAPNPEDIIYDDGDTTQPRESGFEPIPEGSNETDNTDNASNTTTAAGDGTNSKDDTSETTISNEAAGQTDKAAVVCDSGGGADIAAASGHADASDNKNNDVSSIK